MTFNINLLSLALSKNAILISRVGFLVPCMQQKLRFFGFRTAKCQMAALFAFFFGGSFSAGNLRTRLYNI